MNRAHMLAAALLIGGAAGLFFAGISLFTSSSPSAASDEALVFAIGDVPPALGATPVPSDTTIPQLPERSDQTSISKDGKLSSGDSIDSSRRTPQTSPTPLPPTGGTAGGNRQAASSGMNPIAIKIPKIDVAADVIGVGTTAEGAMEAPREYDDVGWWSLGARPGETGRAVLAGHVDSPWGAAVFVRLDELEPGDEILVGDGLSELRYIVRGAAMYETDAAPVEDIFGPSVERELILITCGGWFDRQTASYLHRRVIFAVLADDA